MRETNAALPQDEVKLVPIDRGQIPTITCIDCSNYAHGVDFKALLGALQKYVDQYFAPVWGTPAKLVLGSEVQPGAWTLALFDVAEDGFPFLEAPPASGAIARHRLGKNGLPLAMVFVKDVTISGQQVSVVASHELAEMLVDPAVNLWCRGPGDELFAYEVCDVVEEETFEIDGINMSDFVYPAYFEAFRQPGSTKFDFCDRIERPFQILPTGYSQILKDGRVVTEFGSDEKNFDSEDRLLHRSEFREVQGGQEPTSASQVRNP
jgi:hypothetical protein